MHGVPQALAGILPATAQDIDQVYTKNGSVYEGYIASRSGEKPLDSNRKSHASDRIVRRDIDLVCHEIGGGAFSEQLQEWIKEHQDSVSHVEVATVSIKGDRQLREALVLEHGSRLKLLSVTADRYDLNWDDVLRTTKTLNIEGAQSGIRDIVTMNNGARYEGQIVEQKIPEAEIKVKVLDGNIYTASMKEVMSIRSERIDFNARCGARLRCSTRWSLTDGETVEGFIVSRKIGSDITMILRETGIEKTIPLSRIAKYRKSINADFVAPEAGRGCRDSETRGGCTARREKRSNASPSSATPERPSWSRIP